MHNDSDTIQFPSGAVRCNDADSERYDLITPIGLRRLALTCAGVSGNASCERDSTRSHVIIVVPL
jgi:hypothetical protein